MKICNTCGVVALRELEVCGACKAPLKNGTASVEPVGEGLSFVKVHGHFECRSCGHSVVLSHLDLDGSVLCGKCGIDQKVKWQMWKALIMRAHDTADLGGNAKPAPDAPLWWNMRKIAGNRIANRFKAIGVSKWFFTEHRDTSLHNDLPYVFTSSPGHPVCIYCRKPLDIQLNEGELITECPECRAQATYSLPEQANRYPALVGVIAPSNRTDSTEIKTEKSHDGTVVTISCPKCGGSLESVKLGEVSVCPFCGTSCHIPARILQRNGREATAPAAWWMLFRGPCHLRMLVEEKLAKKKQLKSTEEVRSERKRRSTIEKLSGFGKPAKRQAWIFAALWILTVTGLCSVFFVESISSNTAWIVTMVVLSVVTIAAFFRAASALSKYWRLKVYDCGSKVDSLPWLGFIPIVGLISYLELLMQEIKKTENSYSGWEKYIKSPERVAPVQLVVSAMVMLTSNLSMIVIISYYYRQYVSWFDF